MKCDCGSACWKCYPEPSSYESVKDYLQYVPETSDTVDQDVLWDDSIPERHDTRVATYLQGLVREYGAVAVQDALDETTAGAFLEYCGTDAMRWAEEYAGMHGGDVGLLVGWFANAIEAGKASCVEEYSDTAPVIFEYNYDELIGSATIEDGVVHMRLTDPRITTFVKNTVITLNRKPIKE